MYVNIDLREGGTFFIRGWGGGGGLLGVLSFLKP